ncbi:SepM family pheromone-processing serine protease [Enterococcus sp. LJL98]
MKKNKTIKYLFLLLCAIGLVASFVLPIPYYIERPGVPTHLNQLITVNGQKDEAPGSYSLTSVAIYQATLVRAIRAKFEPFSDIISEKELFGEATGEEYTQMQQYYMTSSQNSAIEQALTLANKPFEFEFKGVYVMHVDPASNFYNQISVGDTVTKVDGKSFKSSQAFMDDVQGKKVGEEVTITFLHHDEEQEAKGALIKLPSNQKAGIGISLIDHTAISSEEKIDFHVENIGGPSAGLMFTLQIYDQLTGNNLRQGREIAGTGTMDFDGKIGRIGGIDKKIAGAVAAGIDIFFAPDDEITPEMAKDFPGIVSNYEEAKQVLETLETDMQLVPVKTVKDAIDYLENQK